MTAIPYGLSNSFLSENDNFFIYPFCILVFYILFFLLWVAGTNVHSVMNHTQQTCLWTCILTNTIPGIKPGGKYSNVCFVTNHSLQKSVWIIISMPYMVRKEMLSKSVVIFDRETADLLFSNFYLNFSFPFLSLFYLSFYDRFISGEKLFKCQFCKSVEVFDCHTVGQIPPKCKET